MPVDASFRLIVQPRPGLRRRLGIGGLVRRLGWRRHVLTLSALLLLPRLTPGAELRRSLLNSNDVVVFVGGENVVAMQQLGYVELLLARETSGKNVRFRNLGWEGDTVFEQRRELNFPSWEKTLDQVGATVVIAQFGQAESMRGREGLAQFPQAADQLLTRLAAGRRSVVLLAPVAFEHMSMPAPAPFLGNADLEIYSAALQKLAQNRGWTFVDWRPRGRQSVPLTRDGLHLNSSGHWLLASGLVKTLGASPTPELSHRLPTGAVSPPAAESLRQAILAKNRLWFDYWRPQNWAFLAGDRTEQPSSRDHRNPKVRWFPNELEQFLPLIEAREREVRQLAGRMGQASGK
jgi:lysophospholipase L1-like esterase